MHPVVRKSATVATYATRAAQVLALVLALYLIVMPLTGGFTFDEGLAWTILGIVALILVIVLEVFARIGRRVATNGDD